MKCINVRKIQTIVCAFLMFLCFFVCISGKCVAYAEPRSVKEIKVVFYPLDGFFEYDESGNEIGYGVEVLNKVSQYTGYKFVYVYTDSWEKGKDMIESGEADIRMPATLAINMIDDISFGNVPIINTYNTMMTLKSREDLEYEDYDTIKTLKIAVAEEYYNRYNMKYYINNIGISESQIIFCADYNESYEKLKNGEADALLSNIMDLTDELKVIERFGEVSNYITAKKGNEVINTINEALEKIRQNEPTYFSRLYKKWFPDRAAVPLTKTEREYIENKGKIVFAFHEDGGYLSRYEDGKFTGIFIEYAKVLAETLGVEYEAVSLEEVERGEKTADVAAGFFYSYDYARKTNVTVTEPYFEAKYFLVQQKGDAIDLNNGKVGTLGKYKYTDDYVKKCYNASQIVEFDTYKECFDAVADGTVDFAIVNNYIAEFYLDKYTYSDLTARLINEYSHGICFAVIGEDDEILSSAMTKMINAMPEEKIYQILADGFIQKEQANTFLLAIYKHPLQSSMIIVVFALVLIATIFTGLYAHKNKKRNKELEYANIAKTDFMSRMSHDMRTPLNAVIGFADLAMKEKEDHESVEDYVEKIKSSGVYLLGLINDVLDMSKIESGKIEFHEEIVDGYKFVGDIAAEFDATSKNSGINFVTEFSELPCRWLLIDKLRNRQIYSNLLSNAFKFSPKGSTITWKLENKMVAEDRIKVKATISDEGCGMSEEFLKHLFEPFSQEVNAYSEKSGGTGLGLSIVKNLVECMGGTINVESRIGKGTTFTIEFERKISTEAPAVETASTGNYSTILSGKHILLCEDHPLNREIAVRMLSKDGMTVDLAVNGEDGVECFKKSKEGYYDAILMDIRMPVMNGIQATKAIRSLERKDAVSVPIIAMTANVFSEDITECREAGMTGHVAKPIDFQILRRTLAEAISHNIGKGNQS